MDAIREEAGVSKPTLYNYYPGKEELFADVHRRFIGESLGDWLEGDDVPLPGSEEELRVILLDFAESFVAALLTQPERLALVRVVIAETPRFPRLGELFREITIERAIALISALLEQMDKRGLAEVEDSEAAARALIGPLVTYMFEEGLLVGEGSPRPPGPERLGASVDLFMKAIRKTSGGVVDGGTLKDHETRATNSPAVAPPIKPGRRRGDSVHESDPQQSPRMKRKR